MENNYRGRLIFISIVVILCAVLLAPSVNYFVQKMTNPNLTDEQEMKLKENAIPLGLDLQGGVDIQLKVDLDKSIEQSINEQSISLRSRFRGESIAAVISIADNKKGINLSLEDVNNYKIAKKIIDEYEFIYDDNKLAKGSVLLTLNEEVARKIANEALDGSLKVIRSRVDEFGVTMPLVAKQGLDRIRVQLPGEKDPEKVIKTLIRPANLEFRLLHDDYDNMIDPKTRKLKEATPVPAGYIVLKGDFEVNDPKTGLTTQVIKDADYIVKEKPELTGSALSNAGVRYDEMDLENQIKVWLMFNKAGTRTFREITTDNLKKRLAIILENHVYSAPVIQSVIPDGQATISGGFTTTEEAKELSLVLKAGAMPGHLEREEQRSVEATLGKQTIKSAIKAASIGSLIVAIFMVVYYTTAGFIAMVAVAVNLLLIAAVMAMFRATLTLSGIAGFLLTVGMAVDANVLIYERIREELKSGQPLKVAIANGFSRAFSTIFDANLTTLITALVLLQFGAGPIQGFAFTMSWGIIATLFTGLFVTHTFSDFIFAKTNKLSTGKLVVFKNPKFDVIGMRFGAYILSGLMLLVGLFAVIQNKGVNMGVDFAGGVLATVKSEKTITTEEIKNALVDYKLTGSIVQKTSIENEFLVRVKLQKEGLDETKAILDKALAEGIKENKLTVYKVDAVGSEVGSDFRNIALKSALIASIGILIYVGVRFEFVFGFAALFALFHDVLITIGILTLMNREISLDIVAALLTVMGYSINDTIVVFDRVRENKTILRVGNMKDLLNISINQCLNRTTLTSLTTLFVVVCMYLFGGAGISDFGLTLMIGIIVGTYSSDFIASPILYEWDKYHTNKTKA